MQQLFSKETFIHTAMGLRSGEDGIGSSRLEQDTRLAEKQPSKAGSLSLLSAAVSSAVCLRRARGSSSIFLHTDGRDYKALATAIYLQEPI